MGLIDYIRGSLRITSSDFDYEISELIDQAVQDMISSGVITAAFPNYGTTSWSREIDDLNIRRAITLYVKANFGIENTEKEWFMKQYLFKKAEILNQMTQYTDYDESDYE